LNCITRAESKTCLFEVIIIIINICFKIENDFRLFAFCIDINAAFYSFGRCIYFISLLKVFFFQYFKWIFGLCCCGNIIIISFKHWVFFDVVDHFLSGPLVFTYLCSSTCFVLFCFVFSRKETWGLLSISFHVATQRTSAEIYINFLNAF
jgi:hypothetical protein